MPNYCFYFFVQMAEVKCLLNPGFVGYNVIMGFSCFLWCFVYIIFVSLIKIRRANRLPLLDSF